MKSYVLSFCFDPDLRTVALIRKNRPEWQAGRLNGIGGHIENGEPATDAMAREFREQTALDVPIEWTCFGCLHGGGWEVFLFHGKSDAVPSLHHEADEGFVRAFSVSAVIEKKLAGDTIPLPNLRYLIPMALNHISGEDKAGFFDILECAQLPLAPTHAHTTNERGAA